MEQLTPKVFAWMEKGIDGFSPEAVAAHYKLYEGYVKKANEINARLTGLDFDPAKANATFSEVRELKVALAFALGGVRNHETYFGHLGNGKSEPDGKLLEAINRDFESVENWKKDMKATALSARGWAWLVYNYDEKRLMNCIGDSQNTFPLWNSLVVVALDVYEHAYWRDYLTDRAGYIDNFFANLDWTEPCRLGDQMTGE